MNKCDIHPEVWDAFAQEARETSLTHPQLDYEEARMFTLVKVWKKCMQETEQILTSLSIPALVPNTTIENIEREIRLQELLDEREEALDEYMNHGRLYDRED